MTNCLPLFCFVLDVTTATKTDVAVVQQEQRGCNFEGDGKFHPAGSRWHPYLPPFGFSKCAVCVCDVSFSGAQLFPIPAGLLKN